MTEQDFGFAFETQGLGQNEGPVDPSEEYFTGSIAESLARETIQNSLDAAVESGPIQVVFELRTVRTDDIPDVDTLRAVVTSALPEYRNHQGSALLHAAADALRRRALDVLRIGDYGTRGLEGSERLEDSSSPLSALTRGSGVSSSDGSRGGSFGIGSKAGLAASTVRTVFFNSRTSSTSHDVFAGYSRQASFTDSQGIRRVASGYFRDRNLTDDFSYLRGWQPFAPFEARGETGTDIYVIGYRGAEHDQRLHGIQRAVAKNFLAAIYRGRLVVTGVTDLGAWTLSAHTLEDYLKNDPDLRRTVYPFLIALQDPEPYIETHPELGEFQLFVNEDDSLDKSLWTWTMRQRLMSVTSYRHTGVSVPYAAVFVATGDEGNASLRALEPPQHTDWETDRAPHGKATVKAVKEFIGRGLHSKIKVQPGKRATVHGLSRYLPSADLGISPLGDGAAPTSGPPHDTESGSIVGRGNPERRAHVAPVGPVRVAVRKPASGADGGSPGMGGRDTGGSSQRTSTGGDKPRPSTPDESGNSRIPEQALRVRSWRMANGAYRLVLRAAREVSGDLSVTALDEDGAVIRGLELPLVSASDPITNNNYPIDPGLVRGVKVSPHEPLTLEISLAVKERYRLGVGE